MSILRRRAPDILAALFGGSSIIHLARPSAFESIIPPWLPNPRVIVYVSGIVELACAMSLLRRTRWAKYASAVVLIGIFPANVQMTVDAVRDAHGKFTSYELATFARLPLQALLVWAAWQATPKVRQKNEIELDAAPIHP